MSRVLLIHQNEALCEAVKATGGGKEGICSFLLLLLLLINMALWIKRGESYDIININSSSLTNL